MLHLSVKSPFSLVKVYINMGEVCEVKPDV